MKKEFRYFLIYFDTDGQGRFLPLLRRCIASFARAMPHEMHNLRIITDMHTLQGTDTLGTWDSGDSDSVVRVDPSKYSHMVRGHQQKGWQFDYKTTLLLAFFDVNPHLDYRCVFLDCDNIIRRNFLSVLEGLPDNTLALAERPQGPNVYHPWFDGTKPEMTSACIVFPRDTGFAYRMCLTHVAIWSTQKMPQEVIHPTREQRTWSLVWHAFNNTDPQFMFVWRLPRTMSWSRLWGAEPPNCYIRHCHGAEKWKG